MMSLSDFEQKQVLFAHLSRGDKISFNNDNIVIKSKDGDFKHQSSCYRIFALIIAGNTSFTNMIFQKARKFHFPIILMSYSLKPYLYFVPKLEGNTILRQKQYEYKSLKIAKYIVKNKISNQIQTLKKLRVQDKTYQINISKAITNIKIYKDKLDKVQDLKSILGIEGISSRVYFENLFFDINWRIRAPRTKIDTINTLLDIGYTKLFYFIEALLNLYGFDIYKGVYHQDFYQRKSLVCDLVEPFRSLIDYRLRKAYKLSQVKEEDFTLIQGRYHLVGKSASPYVAMILEILLKNKRQIFLYVQSYYRAFIRDKMIEEFPFFDITKSEI